MRNDKGIMETSLTFIQAALIFIPVALATIAIIYMFFGGLGTPRDEMTLGVAWRCEIELPANLKLVTHRPYQYTWDEDAIKEVERLRLKEEDGGTKCSGAVAEVNDVSATRGTSAYSCGDNGVVLYQHGFGNEELAQDDDACGARSASISKNLVASGYRCAPGTPDKVKVFDIDAVLATPIASLDIPSCIVNDVSVYEDRVAVACNNGESRLYAVNENTGTLDHLDTHYNTPIGSNTCSALSVSLYEDYLAVGEHCFSSTSRHFATDKARVYKIDLTSATPTIESSAIGTIQGDSVCTIDRGSTFALNRYGAFVQDVALEGDLLAVAWYCADEITSSGDWVIKYDTADLKDGDDIRTYRIVESGLERIQGNKITNDKCMARSVSLHSPLDDVDADKDGLSDLYEKTITKTAPGIADTDGDGYEDGEDPYPRDETRPGFDWEAVETWMDTSPSTGARLTIADPSTQYSFHFMSRNAGDISSPEMKGMLELIKDSDLSVKASHEYTIPASFPTATDLQLGGLQYTFTEGGMYTLRLCFEERTTLPLDIDPSNNCVESAIRAGSVDLNMVDVWTTGLYQVGQTNSVTLRLRVRNDGPESSGPTTATFTVYNKNADGNRGAEAGTISRGISPLNQNAFQDKYVGWTPTAIGDYELEACVPQDPNEIGEANNCKSHYFSIGSDLEVALIWERTGTIGFEVGDTAEFRTKIRNNGPATSPGTAIQHRIISAITGEVPDHTTTSIPALSAPSTSNNNNEVNIDTEWVIDAGTPLGAYTVTACIFETDDELDTTNDCGPAFQIVVTTTTQKDTK